MAKQPIPPRIKWAVDLMDVQPNDSVLEIGCGPGAGAELICEKLETGKLFAIDRSESGVDRTKRRNAKYVEAGRLTVRQIDLATLRVPVKRLNKVFAFNVNLFWVRKCADEVALLHERVLPAGRCTSTTTPTSASSSPTSSPRPARPSPTAASGSPSSSRRPHPSSPSSASVDSSLAHG